MRIFVIGGQTQESSGPGQAGPGKDLFAACREIGEALGRSSHDVIICSPFNDSADHHVLVGLARHASSWPGTVHIHFPGDPNVTQEVQNLVTTLGLTKLARRHPHAPPESADAEARSMAWLLSQMAALDSADVVIAIGGKEGGSAALLLQLTTERRRPVLPFSFFGGAAARAFLRLQYELLDRIGAEGVEALQEPARVASCADLATQLVSNRPRSSARQGQARRPVVFISYSRARPGEADFVEMSLRRRNIEVIRDDHSFGTGHEVPGLISEAIHRSTLFIALWCREYACSPWCFDELEMVLDRRERDPQGEHPAIAIVCLDDTRIIPKRARSLLHHNVRSRDELQAIVLRLLEAH